MATTPLPLQLFVLASVFFSTSIVTAVNGDDAPFPSPIEAPASYSQPLFHEHAYPSSLFGPILNSLGFHGFAESAPSLSNATSWRGPTTIFAPSDSSIFTCPSCSVPLLLREHTVPGLFPLNYMRTLAFGTKVETLAPGRCITFTISNTSEIFVSGVKVTHPDLYNDGLVAVHGLQGYMSHLSPYSCDVERMTSLSFPHAAPATPFLLMRLMLKDAMLRLSITGYGVVSLALRAKHNELINLHSMTVFALDDASIFSGAGYAYVSNFRFHVVPNKLLMHTDLASLPAGTMLPTLERGMKLMITTAGRTGVPKSPVSINYVRIKTPDLMYNLKIVVHCVSFGFPHVHQTAAEVGQSGWNGAAGLDVTAAANPHFHDTMASAPVIRSTAEIDDHHGL